MQEKGFGALVCKIKFKFNSLKAIKVILKQKFK